MLVGAISAVNAADLNQTDAVAIDDASDDVISVDDSSDENGLSDNQEEISANYTPKTFEEIQTTVDSANDGDIIILDGYYLFKSELNVNKYLTFVGKNDATVDGNNSLRLFSISDSGVTFKNITFKNGYANKGGAIYGDCTVINCTFIHNTVDDYSGSGGAVYGVCTAIGCNFIDNYAAGYEGQGGAMNGGYAVNCTFTNNTVSGTFNSYGGAVYDVSAVNCTFTYNSATYGGAMSGGSAMHCTFINNSADPKCSHYGGYSSFGGAMNGGYAINCIFWGNSANNDGGAMYDKQGYAYAINSTFINNSACNGGAVYEIIVKDCNFNDNNASENGGAMCGGYAVNCNFTNNHANNYGGAVYNAKITNNTQFNSNAAYMGNDTYSVTVVNKSNVASNIKTFYDLNNLINGNTDSEVYLNDNYTFDIEFKGGIAINRAVTIYGNGYTIDGCNVARIFTVTNSDVIFKDIIFLNGMATDKGGAINGKCTAINCTFNSNSANNGGAMYGGSAIDCIFVNNSASASGGAMYGGSAIDCIFVNNSASASGGAVYGSDSCVNCSFVNNSASASGGAVSGGSCVNCNFINNSASANGGACYHSTCTHSNFTNNFAAQKGGAICEGESINCIFKDNHANDGGAIYDTEAFNSLFENNFATNDGGAVLGNKIFTSTFNNNRANGYGGAICNANVSSDSIIGNNNRGRYDYGTFNISFFVIETNFNDLNELINNNSDSNINLNNNYTFYWGLNNDFTDGIIINRSVVINGNGYTINADNSARIFNVANNKVTFKNIIFINGKSSNGGALYGNCTVVNCTFISNTATQYGGAMYGGFALDCTFVNNSAGSGGAVYFYDGGSVVNCSFVGNSASSGGVIYGSGSFSVVGCSFVNNSASGDGGAIYISNGPFSVVNCSFVNNSARYGGVIYGSGSGSVVNCSFVNNSALRGGAIYVSSSSGSFSVVGCSFVGNSAHYYGAICISYGSVSVVNCSFVNNSAGSGGAIYSDIYGSGSLSVVGCSFLDNSVGGDGGAIYVSSVSVSVSVVGCSFTGNSANNGGAIYGSDSGSVSVVGCSFVGNSAGFGGAICGYGYGRDSTISFSVVNCSFVNNSASYGGVINGKCFNYVPGSISISAVNCTFINNSADEDGGVIYFDNILISISVMNCTFINNLASNGGAIYVGKGSGSVMNCTFISNSASEKGGSIYGGDVINCIFKNNHASDGGAIYDALIANSLFENNYATNDGGAVSGGKIFISTFNNNHANGHGGAICNANVSTNSILNNNYDVQNKGTYNVSFFEVGTTFIDLNNLINNNNNFNVNLESDYMFYGILNNEFIDGIIINRTVVINGNGHIINGDNSARIFNVANNQVTLKNIIFINGKSSNGGAVYGNCTIINCTFINNSARYGGVMYGGFALDCTFVNNSAYYGSAIYEGSAINCRFINNSANGEYCSGGAIYRGSAEYCTFINNTAYQGGAMAYGSAIDCSFIDNSATKCAGAIYEGSAVNCVFISNSANGAYCHGGAIYGGSAEYCTFINNTAYRGGATSGSASCVNCIFVNNSAIRVNDIIVYGGAMNGGSAVNCTFINNSADYGGAMNEVSAVNCTFINNSASISVGAMYGGSAVNCSFVNNYGGALRDGSAVNCTFIGNSASDGGAICRVSAINCSFIGNSAIRGGAMNDGSAVNCIFVNNSAELDGGAMYGGSAVNCSFISNSAMGNTNYGGNGGAIYEGSAVNCSFENNTAGRNGEAMKGGSVINSTFKGHTSNVLYSPSNVVDCTYDIYPNVPYHYSSVLNVNDLTINIGEEGFLVVNLSNLHGPLSNKNIILNVTGTEYNINSLDGSVCININDYVSGVGKYNFIFTYGGDDLNNPVTKNVTVIIKSYPVLSVNNLSSIYSEDGFLIAHLSDVRGSLANRTIGFIIGGVRYDISTDANGLAELNVKDFITKPGEYIISVAFEGDDVVNPSSNISYVAYKYAPVLEVNDIYVVKNDDSKLSVVLSNVLVSLSSKSIRFNINGKTTTAQTDSRGFVSIKIKDYVTNLGKYTMSVTFNGDDVNHPISKNINVYVNEYKGKLSVSQIGKYYNDTILRFSLINSRNNAAVSNASIKITFSNGKPDVTLITDSNGVADYSVPFAPGTYSLTANVIDSNVDVNTVTLNNFEVKKLIGVIDISQNGTGYDNSDLVIRLYNPNNDKDVFRNVKVNLQFITNGELAEVITNDEGIATYHIPFDIGTYHVLAYVSGEYTSFANVEKDDIFIDKEFSDVIGDPISFAYGSSGSTTMTLVGVLSCDVSVVGHSEAIINRNGNKVTVSNLTVGTYTLQVVTTPDSNHKSVTKTIGITVNRVASSVTGKDIKFDYGGSGSTTLTLSGATGVTANVVGHSEAVVSVNGNKVTVSNLTVGTYTLQVVTTPDSNHNSVTKNIGITVNKVASSVSGKDIAFDYGGSGSTTLTLSGATGVTASVVGYSRDVVGVNGNKVTVSGLNAGSYNLQVVTVPDSNHYSVTKNISITVNRVDSSVNGKDITFDYGGSGFTTLTLNGVSSFTANVLNYPESASIDGNKVTVSNLGFGNYTLQVVTTPDDNHNSVTKNIGITVNKVDARIEFENTISFSTGNLGSTTVKIEGGSTDLSCISVVGHNATISYRGNVISVSGLKAGTYILNVVVKPDRNHNSVNGTIGITVTGSESGSGPVIEKTPSEINFSPKIIEYDWGEMGYTSFTLAGCTVSEDNMYVQWHPEAVINLKGNNIVVSNLTPGHYDLNVITIPTSDLYSSVTKSVSINVRKIDSSISFDTDSLSFDYGGSTSTTLTLNGATGVSANVIGYSNAVTVMGNVVTVSNLNFGNYILQVVTNPDSYHNPVTEYLDVTVNKVNSSIDLGTELLSFDYGGSTSTTLTLNGATGVSANVIDYSDAVTVNGNVVTVSRLNYGNYTLQVVSHPDNNHYSVTKTVNVTVNKVKSNVGFTNPILFDYLDEGTTTLILNGCTVSISDLNIIGYPDVSPTIDKNNVVYIKGLDAGNYTLHVMATPDANHEASECDVPITVNKIRSEIDFTKDVISFKYAKTGSVGVVLKNCEVASMSIVGKSVKPTLKGSTISVSGLDVGKYVLKVTAESTNDNYKSSEAFINVTVTKNTAKITVKTQTFAYKGGKDWQITLKDSSGSPISKVKLKLKVYTGKKYKIYTSTDTDSKGVAKFKASNLAVGNHKIIVSFSHKGYTCKAVTSSVKIIKATSLKITVNTVSNSKGGTISIIVTNSAGKRLNGIKVKLVLNKASKIKPIYLVSGNYKNNNGVCAYSTNLWDKGVYTAQVEPVDIKYKGSGSKKVTITAAAKKSRPYYEIISNGKKTTYNT